MGKVLIDNTGDGDTKRILGGISSSLGAPASSLSISGGGQIQTVMGFNNQGQQAPVYAYVTEGVSTAQISLERGCSLADGINSGGGVSATFAIIGSTKTISGGLENAIPDPTGSQSTGTGGASFSFVQSTGV